MTVNPVAEDLRDNFTGSSLDADKWTAGHSGAGVALVSGQLVLTPDASGSGNAAFISSAESYDLTDSHFAVQVIGLSNNSQTAWVMLTQGYEGTLVAGFRMTGGAAQPFTGSFTSVGSDFTCSAGTWVRLRESQGTFYWDYSTDGSAWTNQASEAVPADVTGVNLVLEGLAATGVTWTATFDSVGAV